MLHVVWHIVTGFVVGLIARAVLPGGDQMGLIATTVVGIVGSVLGGLVGSPDQEAGAGRLVPPGRVRHVPRRRGRRAAGVADDPLVVNDAPFDLAPGR